MSKALARHRLVERLSEIALHFLVRPDARLPMLNAVTLPPGVADAPVRSTLLNEHSIEIGAGLGPLAGKIWGVGLMGHSACREYVDRLVDAIVKILADRVRGD